MSDLSIQGADHLSATKRALLAVRELRGRIDSLERARREPVAIVGMACRFPGGADDPERFWALLEGGFDAVTEVPGERFDVERYYDPDPNAAGKMTTRWGAFLTGVDRFDAAFFGISPREADRMDPQQRLLLETAWEAFEDAGIPAERLAGSQAGVFLGIYNSDWADLQTDPGAMGDAYTATGSSIGVAAGRLAYALDLRGPSLVVDTLCSSSLVAVHLAVRSLRAGDADLAIAGGANVILSPATTILSSRLQALAPDGRCKTFDAAANGYVRSEGVGLVVLKRLSDAVEAGDRILAVVRGTAVNQDGRSTGLTAPNVRAQIAVLRKALEDAGLGREEISFVEAHGTGTSLGDPIEVEALAEVLGGARPDGLRCALSSVKTNLGHAEAAAGIAGLAKTVLAMRHGRLAPHRNFRTLNPRISLEGTPFFIPLEATPWEANGRPRRAGVSSFGLSGTNAHVVLEEAPEPAPVAERPDPPFLVPLSAQSAEALAGRAAGLREVLSGGRDELADVAWTAAVRRTHLDVRLAVVGASAGEIAAALEGFAEGRPPRSVATGSRRPGRRPRVAFVFAGQGSQSPGMGRELLASEPAFRQALERADAAIRPELGASIVERMADPASLEEIDVLQPALFAIQVALAALWRSWGVAPDAVVGHSMGEVAAAHVAGALSLEDAARVLCRRSRLLRRIRGRGAMALVEWTPEEASRELEDRRAGLSIAAINGPRSVVLAGDPEALDRLLADLAGREVFARKVKVDVASHSPQVDPLAGELRAALQGLAPVAAAVPFHSTVRGQVLAGGELGAEYWVDNLRRPVLFGPAIERLAAEVDAFVEVGPHPILVPSILDGIGRAGAGAIALPSLVRDEPERASILGSLGALWSHGVEIAWDRVYPRRGRVVSLPGYPWQRERYRPTGLTGDPLERRFAGAPGGHPLLGRGLAVAGAPGGWIWTNEISVGALPWLADHRVEGQVVLPGAAYLEMALAAGAEAFPDRPVAIEGAVFEALLALPAEEAREVQVALAPDGPEAATFRISSRAGDGWTRHASGRVRVDAGTPAADGSPAPDGPAAIDGDRFYEALAAAGLEYGPAFRGVREVRPDDGRATAGLALPDPARSSASSYRVHPALLDACLQVLAAAAPGAGDELHLPSGVGRVRLAPGRRMPDRLALRATARRPRDGELEGDLVATDESGEVVLEIRGVSARRVGGGGRAGLEDRLFELAWREAALDAAPAGEPGDWLLVTDGAGVAEGLARLLRASGARIELAPPGRIPAVYPGRGIVHLGGVGLEGGAAAAADACWSATSIVQGLSKAALRDPPRLWIVTRGAVAALPGEGCPSLAASTLWGLARTVAHEHPELSATRVDLDPAAAETDLERLAGELLAGGPEDQVAFRGGKRLVARLARARRAPPAPRPARRGRFRLEIARPGSLEDLVLAETAPRRPGPGEVEIEVRSAGLNFLDVLLALGALPPEAAPPGGLGGECAGTIRAVGPGVDPRRVGEEVVALAPGSIGTHAIARAELALARPARLGWDEAATLPIAFLTAHEALVETARLAPSERVLVHAAAGGVGLAAIQIARACGAEVLATAGSDDKRARLRELGVRHVFDSRSLEFAAGVREATGGEGVDVVLNSLSGDAIEASLSVLRDLGRFVEIGKRDAFADHRLGLRPFLKNLSYSLVDLVGLLRLRPARIAASLASLLARVEAGELRPILGEVFPVERAADAFRHMAQARHIGKIAISMDGAEAVEVVPGRDSGLAVREGGAYVITGGLGGLGLAVARRLVERGAGHVTLVGRRGPSPAARAVLEELSPSVSAVQADVARRDQLSAVLDAVRSTGRSIRGIVHSAVVLDDATLANLDRSRFHPVFDPKIEGARNLHDLTLGDPLDFFVLFASVSSLLGSPGQANYAAANAYLDALAHERASRGLPALSIDWGPWAEVGQAAASENRGERLAARGLPSLSPEEGLAAFEALVEGAATPQVAVLPFDLRRWRQFHGRTAAWPVFAELAAAAPGAAGPARRSEVRERILAARPDERTGLVEEHLRAEIGRVLRLPLERIGLEAPLQGLGLDSLMALELRNRLEESLGLALPATLIWAHPSVARLAAHLATKLVPADAPEPAPPAAPSDIESLTDEEAEARLLARLDALEGGG